jgi:hypothetical protein
MSRGSRPKDEILGRLPLSLGGESRIGPRHQRCQVPVSWGTSLVGHQSCGAPVLWGTSLVGHQSRGAPVSWGTRAEIVDNQASGGTERNRIGPVLPVQGLESWPGSEYHGPGSGEGSGNMRFCRMLSAKSNRLRRLGLLALLVVMFQLSSSSLYAQC